MAKRPTPRPADLEERAMAARESERIARRDEGPSRDVMERGELAPGRSMRPMARPKRNFAEGGMVRGCKPAQMSGKGFSGSF